MAKSTKGKPAAKPAAKAVRAPEAPVAEERSGMTWEDGVAIFTAVALIAAILVADKGLAGYGAGTFF